MSARKNHHFLGIPYPRLKRWLTLAGILTLVGFFLFGEDGFWRTILRKRGVQRLEAKIDTVATVNKAMRTRMNALKAGDKYALEEEARARGMVKQGEKVYVMEEKKTGK
jgi:cell division protein FtsB